MLKLDMKVTALKELLGGRGAVFTDRVGVNDAVRGTDQADNINTGGGNDRIYSGGGNDVIDAGDGNDFVDAGTGDDIVKAGAGSDTVYGGAGNDTILGEEGNDWLSGDAGNDYLDGGNGNDWVFGGAGADQLLGGTGNDQIWGGAGDDTIAGERGNDALGGEAGNDLLYGGDGNDWLSGGTGNDYLIGGYGADWLSGDAGDDTLYGSDGNGRDGAADVFSFGFSEARSVASAVNGVGNDIIADFEAGRDLVDIRSIVARFYDQQQAFYNFIDQRTGGNWSSGDISVALQDVQSYGEQSAKLTFSTSGGSASVTFHGMTVAELGSSALLKPSWKLMYGSDAAETFTTPATDYKGASGANVQLVVYAGGGDDIVNGGGGSDRLYGEAGNDTLSGGAGDDGLSGGAGMDILSGGTGNDSLSGGDGTDRLEGGVGADRLGGDAGDDQLYGDSLTPDDVAGGNDALWGGVGNDILWGGAGNDVLYGEAGSDALRGGTGADILDGGAGNDSLSGGGGSDLFLFRGKFVVDWVKGSAWLDLGAGGSNTGHDVIEDFVIGQDKVRLAIEGRPDDKTIFTRSLGHTWLPDVPEQDQRIDGGVWQHILTQIDTNGNGFVDALRIAEPSATGGGAAAYVTGDTSWSITVKGVFSDAAAHESLTLSDVFEVV